MQYWKTWSLVLLPLTAVAVPQTSFAQSPRIYVIPPQLVEEDGNAGDILNSAILNAVKENPIVVISPKISSGGGGDLGELQKQLGEGIKYIESEPEKAIDIIKAVVDGYESSMASVEDLDPYLSALVALADAYLMAGYEDEFYNSVRKFAGLCPQDSPRSVSEDLADAILQAQERVRKASPGTVKISASEDNFFLRVDGVEVEDATKPLKLTPGVHFVVVSAPGKAPYVERVQVASGKTVTVNATLVAQEGEGGLKAIEKASSAPPKGLLASLKKGVLDDEVRKQAVRLAEKNKAELVVLTIVARDSAQYRAYPYVLRARDAALVPLATPSFLPGPAAALSAQASEILEGLVQAAYAFPQENAIPASPPIVIEAKGPPVPVAVAAGKGGGKVDPYSVDIAALPTDIGSDQYLEAPPDARGSGARGDGYVIVRYPEGAMPLYDPSAFRGKKRGSRALDPYPVRPPRDPITFAEIREKWWFWPAVGVVAAGVLGAGASTVIRPHGLEAVVTWP